MPTSGSMTNYLEEKLLDHVFRNVALTSPTTVYLALYTVAPGDAGGGTEVSGNGYSRKTVAFGAYSGGTIQNSAAVTFTASGGNWGTIVAVAYLDAATSGNMLHYAALEANKTVNDGDTISFAAGELRVTYD